MATGVRITVKMFREVREHRKDDVRVKVWTGTRWTYLCFWPYSPRMAELCDYKAHQDAVTLEFLPPGVVPRDRLVYLKKILPRLQRSGLVI